AECRVGQRRLDAIADAQSDLGDRETDRQSACREREMAVVLEGWRKASLEDWIPRQGLANAAVLSYERLPRSCSDRAQGHARARQQVRQANAGARRHEDGDGEPIACFVRARKDLVFWNQRTHADG